MENFGEQFLHQKDSKLQISKPVEHEQKRKERLGERPAQKPSERLDDWMAVLDRTHMGHRDNPEVLERIKGYYRKNYVIKSQDVPESTFLLEQRIAREQGHGTIEITDEFREAKTGEIISNQRKSLDKWIDYLTSPDAQYPMWAKYWAFTSMVNMGKFEKIEEEEDGGKKEIGRYAKRTKDTTAAFPILNPRALALTIGVMTARLRENQKSKENRIPVENKSIKLDDPEFQKLLSSESFSKIYTQFLIELPEYSTQGLQETRGKWVKYEQNSDPKPLVDSLEGYPLEWCTANIDTARTQLQGGDFYVYYSLNSENEAVIPRVAIRMQEEGIAEVRGIAPQQNLDPYIGDVVKEKMKEFPDGEQYEKKAADMKLLTTLEKKQKEGKEFTKEELNFLYEIDDSIEGFGYQKDPRIAELCSARNSEEDMLVIFDATSDEIAWNPSQINENTKAYVGQLEPGIFQKLPKNVEHIYISFPDKKIGIVNVEIGGKSAEQLLSEMEAAGINISEYAKSMLKNREFVPGKNVEVATLIGLTVADLGFKSGATIDQTYERAQILGLELCPADTGPELRLKYRNQPLGKSIYMGMKQITGADDNPNVFVLEHNEDGLCLEGSFWMHPHQNRHSSTSLVFRLRKPA